jgi:hypothetical protein
MTDLAQPTLSSLHAPLSNFKKNKLLAQLNSMISDTPFNREFKERVFKSLTGEYTQEDVERIRQEQDELLRQIDEEMENKECISATESKVFLGSAKEISHQYIEDE